MASRTKKHLQFAQVVDVLDKKMNAMGLHYRGGLQMQKDPASLLYIAPFAGCAMGEDFYVFGKRCFL